MTTDLAPPLRIIVVDDNPDDRTLVARALTKELGPVEIVEVTDAESFRRALDRGGHDVTITDYQLRWTDGLTVLRRMKEAHPHRPVIMFTGTGTEEIAVSGMRTGLDDYVLKTPRHYARLPASVRAALAAARHRTAEEATRDALERLAHAATHDALTGLPNRTLLSDRLTQALARVERGSGRLAVLFLDLDRFKVVNDSIGHEAGDELLVTLAARLAEGVRPGDTVARFGGDEFVLLCEGWHDLRDVIGLTERVLAAVRAPVDVRGRPFVITASVGIAVAESGREDPGALLRDADVAMYHAKAGGGGRPEVFDGQMRTRLLAALEVEAALRRALPNGGLQVAYQPIVRLDDGRPVGVEALARLHNAPGALIPPGAFIPVAEDTGLIVDLGHAVIARACREVAALRHLLPDEAPSLLVNLTALELSEPGLARFLDDTLAASGLRPADLCLEMTETSVMTGADANVATLRSLRSLGLRLAIDDFGTGYSSLAYLQRFPIDYLKIDRGFIRDLGVAPGSATMVSGIISLAHALGIQVVAEGVETEAQRDILVELGCDLAQGFLFSHPVGPADLAAVLATPAR